MSRETYIWIAFCVFAFLIGLKLKNRFGNKKEPQSHIEKNQRPKAERGEVPVIYPRGRRKREKTVKIFTIIMMILIFIMLVLMIPALMMDIRCVEGVNYTNLFLRILIFIFAIIVFVTAYIKLAKQSKRKKPGDLQ